MGALQENEDMNRKQWKHASRLMRANGLPFALKFFRNYPQRIDALIRIYS